MKLNTLVILYANKQHYDRQKLSNMMKNPLQQLNFIYKLLIIN